MTFSRRSLLKLAGLSPLTKIIGLQVAHAEDRQFKHAITLFDDIKYPADFKHFDYVNPAAPKGGHVRLATLGSFDSLNPYTFKGDPANGAMNETLFTRSLDEPSTSYGLIAESVWFPEDKSSVSFRLRKEARFHDGTPITPEDLIWSLTALKDAHPQYNQYYKNVTSAEQTGDNEVTFLFSEKNNRELPSIVAELPALSKAWWTAKDANGKPRDIKEPSLDVSLGSGSYKVSDVKPGASLTIKRVEDYWGKDLPVNLGTDNIDEITTVFFNDANVAFEAFKGDQADWRTEYMAKNWATGYDFPAVKDGRVIKEELTTKSVEGMQGWVFNLRRAKFSDIRVRRAFNLAFDFEWAKTNLFYDQYERSRSFFNKSDMEAKGLPSPEELAILEPLRNDIPPEVFTVEFANPVNATPQDRRKNLRAAAQLLDEAGWKATQDGGKSVLKNAKGEVLTAEFLLYSPVYERSTLPYIENLKLLGIDASVKTIDTSQYERRQQTFDYDIVIGSWGQSLSPGNEQREFWGSEAATKNGSRNYSGISNPAIDKIIETLIFAKDRQSLITACRALDRVLIWSSFLVPQWFTPFDRVAYWNRYSRPDKLPDYAVGFPTIWWWDADKAKKTGGAS